MTTLKKLNFLLLFLGITNLLLAQSNTLDMTVVSGKVTNEIEEITAAENSLIIDQSTTATYGTFEATIWPNPSNLGKVRLSIENLPSDPLFIQVFNHKEELVQEGVIQGTMGAKLEHTLELPNVASGNYSIKLSNAHKLLKDLNLEIL